MRSGGQNRTHAQIEKFKKVDSFKIGDIAGGATLRWPDGGAIRLEVSPDIVWLLYRYQEREYREPVEISRVANHYGGARPFLICPDCGRRVRFLYLRWRVFRCRSCARLNYASQQRTKDEFAPYYAAVKMLREQFKTPEGQIPVPMDLPHFFPDKPKGMRWATYSALMGRYEKLQRQYSGVFVARARAFLNWL